jgi:hypothetical protein
MLLVGWNGIGLASDDMNPASAPKKGAVTSTESGGLQQRGIQPMTHGTKPFVPPGQNAQSASKKKQQTLRNQTAEFDKVQQDNRVTSEEHQSLHQMK